MENNKYIIHVIVNYGGGVRTVVKNLINYQIQEGYKVGIMYPKHNKISEKRILNELDDRVKLLPVATNDIKGTTQIMGMPIKRVYEKIILNFQTNKIIFHAHSAGAVGLLRDISDVPIICSLHSINAQGSKISQLITSLIIKKLMKNNSTVIGVSNFVSNFYNKQLNNKYIKTVLNGMHIESKTQISRREKFTIGFVGVINDSKGWEYLLDAYNLLDNIIKDNINLVFAGDGDQRDIQKLKKQIEINRLHNQVKYLGKVENASENVIPYLDLLVLPSENEAFGMVLVEAIGNGIPILATQHGGIPDILSEGYNGFFIERNPTDIAKKIQYIYRKPQLYDELRKNSYSSYIDKFTTEQMNQEYLELYSRVD